MFLDKEQAIDFVYESYMNAQRYQMYEDLDARKRNPDLTKLLLQQLSFGENVLITGSKGKGSVARMLSAVLQTSVERVGMFTSPHIVDFCERIQINGGNIPDASFVKYANLLHEELADIKPKLGEYISPIGITAAMALHYFKEKNTNVNIIEGGKGMRYDDTKNILHRYGVIQPIFLEHTRELGKTLTAIAEDKSELIQEGQACVFIAEQEKEVRQILRKRALKYHVDVREYEKDFVCENIRYKEDGMIFDVVTEFAGYTNIQIPLLGVHQAKNCAVALAVAEEICGKLDEESLKDALGKISYAGRMEIFCKEPFTILDACINRASVLEVKEVAARYPHERMIAVLAIPQDKDYLGVAQEIGQMAQEIIFTSTDNPHYHFSREQADAAEGCAERISWVDGVKNAYDAAKKKDADIICILGTTSMITNLKR